MLILVRRCMSTLGVAVDLVVLMAEHTRTMGEMAEVPVMFAQINTIWIRV